MSSCSKISKNLVLAACDHASNPALEPEAILLNIDDIDKGESTVTGGVISALEMLGSAKGYRWVSARNGIDANATLVRGTYRNAYQHQVVVRVFEKTQDEKDQINKLTGARVVAIVKNVDRKNVATKYEVYGWENGLELTDFQAPTTDTDGIVGTVTLQSSDNTPESMIPMSLYATSEAATDALVAGLWSDAE